MSDIVERLRNRDAIVMAGLFYAIPVMNDAAAEIERLRKALEPFAAIGGLLRMAGRAIPDGASAHYLNLDGLFAKEFKDAHLAFIASSEAES